MVGVGVNVGVGVGVNVGVGVGMGVGLVVDVEVMEGVTDGIPVISGAVVQELELIIKIVLRPIKARRQDLNEPSSETQNFIAPSSDLADNFTDSCCRRT
jgi:hypothetical protein